MKRGTKNSFETKFCVECGESIRKNAEICPKCGVRQPIINSLISKNSENLNQDKINDSENKSLIVALILSIFVGSFIARYSCCINLKFISLFCQCFCLQFPEKFNCCPFLRYSPTVAAMFYFYPVYFCLVEFVRFGTSLVIHKIL